jgi:hypothetical protein
MLDDLARKQTAQGKVGREQARLAKIAGANLRGLINEAIQRGLAQRVD